MYHCQVQRRLFTALKNGQVIVWDTSVLPLQRLAVVPDGASPASGPIMALDYDLSTSTLFTGSKEGISLWAVKASDSGCSGWGRKLGQFSSMSSAPTAVAWAISSREVMAGFANGAVVIFDLDKGEASYAIQAHSDEVTAVMWLDAPRRLLTASKDKTLKIWDFPSLQRAPLDAISLTSSSMSQKVQAGAPFARPRQGADPLLGRPSGAPVAATPSSGSQGFGFNPLNRNSDTGSDAASTSYRGSAQERPTERGGDPLAARGLPVTAGAPARSALQRNDSDDDLAGWDS
ncbi:unnamed protein product, partial [Polarella glacialis]